MSSRRLVARRPTALTASAPKPRPGLAHLIEELRVGGARIIAAPRGADSEIRGPRVYDPLRPPVLEAHDVVLAVGVAADSDGARGLLSAAAGADVAAVVFQIDDYAPASLIAHANAVGATVVGISAEMPWGHLYTLIRNAVAMAVTSEKSLPGVALGDLSALANAIATVAGGPVTIEDRQSRVLAYSSTGGTVDGARQQTILDRRVPAEWVKRHQETGIFAQLLSCGDPIEVPAEADLGYRRRLAIAVRAGSEYLGSIWLAETEEGFAPDAADALRQVAPVASVHLLHYQAVQAAECEMRTEALRHLLDGYIVPDRLLRDRLGLEPTEPVTVLAIRAPELSRLSPGQRQRALDVVAIECSAFGCQATCEFMHDAVYALIPTPLGVQDEDLCRVARRCLDSLSKLTKPPIWAGIGGTAASVEHTSRSRAEADQVLQVLSARDGEVSAVASISEVQSSVVLLEIVDALRDRPQAYAGKINALIEHDNARGAHFIETLGAYLDAFGDSALASQLLQIHPNTLRYRLRRLAELGNIDLSSPDERLALHIQLRLLANQQNGTNGHSDL